MNNILKYGIFILFVIVGAGFFMNCDDDDLGSPDRLFRPQFNETFVSYTSFTVEWDRYEGAYEFELKLSTDSFQTILREIITDSTNYTFDGLEYDTPYYLMIRSLGTTLVSEYYTIKITTLDYPTMLINPTEADVVDTEIRVRWKDVDYDYLGVYDDNGLVFNVPLTAEDNENKEIIISKLTPQTTYKVMAYSYEGDVAVYEGKKTYKTTESQVFEGDILDLRDYSDEESAELITPTFISEINETYPNGAILILKGGADYYLRSSIRINADIKFVTGLSLRGYARVIQSAAVQGADGARVGNVTFEKINFISDRALGTPIRDNTDRGFGGRQVYNVNGTNSILNNLEFNSCRMDGYRAIVRLQGSNDGVRNLIFEGCTINGVGDQGVVTTNNQSGATLESVTFSNSTITNIVMMADLRSSASAPKFIIKDCTFCYAPIETTANANTPMFRFASNPVELNVSNTIFGPSMASEGSAGASVATYTAGTAGSIILNATASSVSVNNSYKTNFTWTVIAERTYPLEDLSSIAVDEKSMFTDPSQEDFKIQYNFGGAKSAGAIKWRME
jgi:hypothetical protein